MTFDSKYFGLIDILALDEEYETEIPVNKHQVEAAIIISSLKVVTIEKLQEIDEFLDSFDKSELQVRAAIQQDLDTSGMTKSYFENLSEEEPPSISVEDLVLLRIFFYPEEADKTFAVLDFTIDEELTDDLLVVNLRKDKTLRISVES